jgi:hypothetical protein
MLRAIDQVVAKDVVDQTLGFQEEDAIASDLRRVSDAGGS